MGELMNTINGRTPEEIKKGLECYIAQNTGECEDISCRDCAHYDSNSSFTITACRDALAYIQQLERERTARWQLERRGKDGITELPVCSGCGATPKYYAPKNDVGMQVPPYCHECGSKMEAAVKMEVE